MLHDDAKFNNKVDIWALGCILYETGTGIRLFPNDFTVLHYSLTEKIDFPVEWPSIPDLDIASLRPKDLERDIIDAIMYSHLHRLVFSLLQRSPSLRPSSRAILERFIPDVGSASEWGVEGWPIIQIVRLLACLVIYNHTSAAIAQEMKISTEEVSLPEILANMHTQVERFCQTNAERIARIGVELVILHESIYISFGSIITLHKELYNQVD